MVVIIGWRILAEQHNAEYGFQEFTCSLRYFFSFYHFLPPDMMMSMIFTITFIGIFMAVTSEIEYVADVVLIARSISWIELVTRIIGQPVIELPLADSTNLVLFNDLLG